MSPASHMVGRLRKLYRIVWGRMRLLNERRTPLSCRPLGLAAHSVMEPLELRLLLSGDVVPLGSLYDCGASSISSAWFEDLVKTTGPTQQGVKSVLEQTPGDIQSSSTSRTASALEERWIVQLTRDALTGVSHIADTVSLFSGSAFGIEVVRGLGMAGQLLIETHGAAADAVSAWLSSNTSVAYASPDMVLSLQTIPNDLSFSQLWGMNNTGQTGGTADADIDAPEAWNLAAGSPGVVVGVIDTGVDYTHPDLAANIWTNPGEIAGNGIDDDGNGFIDDIHGYDFANNDGDPMDDCFHGTHVSGTIAGVGNNGVGVVGVNWNASIMGLKFLDSSGSGYDSDAVRAINYATMMHNRGVNINLTSNSWGGVGFEQSLQDAIQASGTAGMLFVAAAGNGGLDGIGDNNDTTPDYPASYPLDNIISVAATDRNDARASFSNYGAVSVDLGAPGASIYSTMPTVQTPAMTQYGLSTNYDYLDGTSMAAPHVAGVAALAWSVAPTASYQTIRDAILNGVDHIPSMSGVTVTGGRLNAYGALQQLGPDTAGPTVAAQTPSGTVWGGQSAIQFQFNELMDTSSFAVADDVVSFTGPGGELRPQITGFTWVDGQTLRVQFNSRTALGAYQMVIGPNITDDAPSLNPMNQDGDATNGEDPADRYSGSFTIVESPVAVYSANMSTNPGWMLDAGTAPYQWQYGAPTGSAGDPTSGHTGSSVVGYNLNGAYPDSMSVQYATTPAFSTVGYTDLKLGFWRWLGVESSSYDHANVEVWDGTTWTTLWNHTGDSLSDTSWSYVQYSLPASASNKAAVKVRWGMGPTDYSVTYSGWNLDDVIVTGTPTGPDTAGPTVTAQTPLGSVSGGQSVIQFQFNESMDTGSFAVADDVVSFTGPGGELRPQITGFTWVDGQTLRVQFNSQTALGMYTMVIGPNITDDAPSLNPMNQDGDATNGESPDDRYSGTFTIVEGPVVVYSATMDVNPGWSFAGQWAWGQPTGAAGDPSSGYTGTNVVGYNLNGAYPNSMPVYYAGTPAIDCSGYENVTLSFQRWLGVESSSYDHANIQVSNDGLTWTTIWSHSGGSFQETSWSYQEYDISAVADGESAVYVRWGMGPTDDSVTYSGWNLDDVTLNGTMASGVSGMKWYDADQNGEQDVGEQGLPGWTIYADFNEDGNYDAGEPFAVTAQDGNYVLEVPAGTYQIREVLQAGWTQTHPAGPDYYTVTLGLGETVSGLDFGNWAVVGEIRGSEWFDLDQNAQWDAGEPGLEGWTVYLDIDEDGQYDEGVEPSQVTGADGSYAFTNLMPATYTVGEVLQDGWEQTFPGGGTGYMEDFSDGLAQDWLPLVADNWSVVDEEYRAAAGAPDVGMQSMYLGQNWEDFSAEAVMRRTGSDTAAAVLIVRATDDYNWLAETGSGYMVGISADGSYYVVSFVSGAISWLTDGWVDSPYLNTGATPNTVRTRLEGSSIEVYFNDNLAWSGTDTSITGPGRIALGGYTGDSAVTDHYFDNVSVLPVMALATGPGTHSIVVAPGEVVEDVDFGNWAATPQPGEPDLLPGNIGDTGAYDDDNVTRFDNGDPLGVLQFAVGGTIAGATVTLYADATPIGSAVASGSMMVVTTNGSVDLADGWHSVTARQTLPGRAESNDSAALDITVDTVAPRVSAFGLSSSWFKWALGVVDSSVWMVPGRTGATVPWVTIDHLVTSFDEPVFTDGGDAGMAGVITGDIPLALAGGNGTDTLTWATPAFLGTDRYNLTLLSGQGGFCDRAGNVLDGEGGLPSGDGAPGGNWQFDLNVLVGNVVDRPGVPDPVVDTLDRAQVILRLGKAIGDSMYTPLADINGDGRTDTLDRAQVIPNLGRTLPPPAEEAQASPMNGHAAVPDRRPVGLGLILPPTALNEIKMLSTLDAAFVGPMPSLAVGQPRRFGNATGRDDAISVLGGLTASGSAIPVTPRLCLLEPAGGTTNISTLDILALSAPLAKGPQLAQWKGTGPLPTADPFIPLFPDDFGIRSPSRPPARALG